MGADVGTVGSAVALLVGLFVVATVGFGSKVGSVVGSEDGSAMGSKVGSVVGSLVGVAVGGGPLVGGDDGLRVGAPGRKSTRVASPDLGFVRSKITNIRRYTRIDNLILLNSMIIRWSKVERQRHQSSKEEQKNFFFENVQ